jgi:hypothetical protein
MCCRKTGFRGAVSAREELRDRAYFGGVFESAGGGVELMEPFGLLGGVELSEGGMVVVVPGDVDSVAGGGAVDVSAGGELAEPAGEVDSCLEQADKSASEPTHNNRTLRFIKSPHYCNGTVTTGLSKVALPTHGSQAAFRRLMPGPRPRLRRPPLQFERIIEAVAKKARVSMGAHLRQRAALRQHVGRNSLRCLVRSARREKGATRRIATDAGFWRGLELLRTPGALGSQNGAAA